MQILLTSSLENKLFPVDILILKKSGIEAEKRLFPRNWAKKERKRWSNR